MDDRVECGGSAATISACLREALLLPIGTGLGVSWGHEPSRDLWHGLLGLVDTPLTIVLEVNGYFTKLGRIEGPATP